MFCPLACIFPSVQHQGIEMRVIEEGMHHSLLHRLEHISERNTWHLNIKSETEKPKKSFNVTLKQFGWTFLPV